MEPPHLVFEPLGPQHRRAEFVCGVPALDQYLHKRASQDVKRNIARVFVAVVPDTGEIVGYYTLSTFAIALDQVPADLARKLPRYGDLPAALIGRLARGIAWTGKGIGEILLADAVARVIDASSRLAVYAVVVHAKDAAAEDFYRSFGFRHQVSNSSRLFLPLGTALDGLGRLC